MKKPIVENIDDLKTDIAGTRGFLKVERGVDPALIEADWQCLQEHGFVIMKNLISNEQADAVKTALTPLFDKLGRNDFEGERTQRIYSTMAKTRAVDWLATHPRILALLDKMFMPNYRLSQLLGINILPGESAQYLHPDDGFYPVPRPRAPLGAASIFALDDFTEENGATRIIPKSHLWGDRKPTKYDKVISAVMPKGSAIFYGGTFWHGGGANTSDKPRMALTAQYCEPWLRQQENLMMAIPKDIVRKLDPQLKSLLGYSILPPYIGMVNGVHPLRLLDKG